MSRSRPGWWREIDASDTAVVEAARRVENGAATQLTKIRKMDGAVEKMRGGASEPWTIRLSAEDANAWLGARLRPWLESQEVGGGGKVQWPRDLERVEVRFEDGRIQVGAAVKNGADESARRYLSATLVPELRSDGGLWMSAASVSVGRLALPPSWMLGRVKVATKEGAPAEADIAHLVQLKDVMRALAGERAAMQTAVIKIGDGRRVRLTGLEARDGALYVTCQTLPRETTRAEK